MNDLKKIFSGGNAEKRNEMHQAPRDIYCESQNVSDFAPKEDRKGAVESKENKKKRFTATYNMFF